MFSFKKVQAAALAGVLILASCGDDDDNDSSDTTEAAESTTPDTEAPDTTEAAATTTEAPVTTEAAPEIDEEAAAVEAEANLVLLFEQLAIAGDPATAPADATAAVEAAAGLIEGGDSTGVQAQIPGIAALAFAAQIAPEIDGAITFNADGEAKYVYNLVAGGTALLGPVNATAVLDDGVWKWSEATWAGLVAEAG